MFTCITATGTAIRQRLKLDTGSMTLLILNHKVREEASRRPEIQNESFLSRLKRCKTLQTKRDTDLLTLIYYKCMRGIPGKTSGWNKPI